MSEKDVAAIDFLEDTEHFADLLNTYYFHGQQVVSPDDVHEQNRSHSISQTSTKSEQSIVITRDIIRKVTFQMKATIIAIEEQSDIHYAMPLRYLQYDKTVFSC